MKKLKIQIFVNIINYLRRVPPKPILFCTIRFLSYTQAFAKISILNLPPYYTWLSAPKKLHKEFGFSIQSTFSFVLSSSLHPQTITAFPTSFHMFYLRNLLFSYNFLIFTKPLNERAHIVAMIAWGKNRSHSCYLKLELQFYRYFFR
jgi:hypothetical protein